MSASVALPTAPPVPRVREVRVCVRPGCGRRATTTLRFDYSERTLMLDPLGPDTGPGEYDLCLHHAARSNPPSGWTLRDRAPSPETVTEPEPPTGPDRGPGVARLAAALSAVPRAVSEDAPDAAPDGAGRPVGSTVRGAARLDGLVRPSVPVSDDPELSQPVARVRPVPLSERTPEVAVRPVPQPLRLVPDPTTTVWCADLLAVDVAAPLDDEPPLDDEMPTLFV